MGHRHPSQSVGPARDARRDLYRTYRNKTETMKLIHSLLQTMFIVSSLAQHAAAATQREGGRTSGRSLQRTKWVVSYDTSGACRPRGVEIVGTVQPAAGTRKRNDRGKKVVFRVTHKVSRAKVYEATARILQTGRATLRLVARDAVALSSNYACSIQVGRAATQTVACPILPRCPKPKPTSGPSASPVHLPKSTATPTTVETVNPFYAIYQVSGPISDLPDVSGHVPDRDGPIQRGSRRGSGRVAPPFGDQHRQGVRGRGDHQRAGRRDSAGHAGSRRPGRASVDLAGRGESASSFPSAGQPVS